MKDKIEISQADLLVLMKEKVDFLTSEYRNLHDAFEYKGRGKVKSDPIKITNSYENFLKQEGDIKRIREMYNLFNDTDKTVKKTTEK